MCLSSETLFLIAALVGLFILYGIWPYGLFKKLKIPGPKPHPFIGNLMHYRKGWYEFDVECYKKYGRVWGIYEGRVPIICIMDTAMLKTVLVKECYTLFTNRRNFGLNKVVESAILIAEDEQWKRIRTVLSPLFTSGKLKEMFPILLHYRGTLLKNLQKKQELTEAVDMRAIFTAYSLDVIASTAFSIDMDTLKNPDDPIVKNVRALVTFSLLNPLLIISVLFPCLIPILETFGCSILPKDTVTFFANIVKRIKEERQKGIHKDRVDFLQEMMNSQTSEISLETGQTYKGLTDQEIIVQALILLIGGYETSSTSLTFLAYNLATHPDVQRKLQQEIDEAFPNKAALTYDGLMRLQYLDMVINESLRLFPPFGRIDRVCKKTSVVHGVTIPKGMLVMVPVYALHHDPELWPEPEEFRPERFGKDNKDSVNQFAHLPFGAGPRNCIGMRFAMMSMKLAITSLLQNYSFVPCKETQIPVELDTTVMLMPKNAVILKLVPKLGTE